MLPGRGAHGKIDDRKGLFTMMRMSRHTGEIKKDMDAAVGADGAPAAQSGEHKTFGIETRVLVATGLLGVMTYAIFKHDPVPRKPRLKGDARGAFDSFSSGTKQNGFTRRQLEEQIEQEVAEAEDEIDDEFEHTDLDDDELEVSDDEDEEEDEG